MSSLLIQLVRLVAILATSPFALVPDYQIVCADAGGRCEEICLTKCKDLQPDAFRECLKTHKATRCQYKHTENYSIKAKTTCQDPLSLIHAFVYESANVQPLYEPPRGSHVRRLAADASESSLPGRRLQSSSDEDSILRIWGWLRFDGEFLSENCTKGVNRQFSAQVVCGVGPYDDFACVHNDDLWNKENIVKTYIRGESPDTLWVDLTHVPVLTIPGEVYPGIQVWVDLSPCFTKMVRADEAGIKFTALHDFSSYE